MQCTDCPVIRLTIDARLKTEQENGSNSRKLSFSFFLRPANVVAKGIVSRVFVHACVRASVLLLARYLAYSLTEFDQTFTINGLFRAKIKASNFGVRIYRVNISETCNALGYANWTIGQF